MRRNTRLMSSNLIEKSWIRYRENSKWFWTFQRNTSFFLRKKWTRPVISSREKGQNTFTVFPAKHLFANFLINDQRGHSIVQNNNAKVFVCFVWDTRLKLFGKHTSQFVKVCKQEALPFKTCTLQQNLASKFDRKNAGLRACHPRKCERIGGFCWYNSYWLWWWSFYCVFKVKITEKQAVSTWAIIWWFSMLSVGSHYPLSTFLAWLIRRWIQNLIYVDQKVNQIQC